MDPNVPIVVLPGTDWSFQVLTWVPYLWQAEAPKIVLGKTFCAWSVLIIIKIFQIDSNHVSDLPSWSQQLWKKKKLGCYHIRMNTVINDAMMRCERNAKKSQTFWLKFSLTQQHSQVEKCRGVSLASEETWSGGSCPETNEHGGDNGWQHLRLLV